MMGNFKRWDVCWTKVKYEDTNEFKDRPIVILHGCKDMFYAMKCTTHLPRSRLDYSIAHWKECRLPKPTVVRTSKIIHVPICKVRKKSGRLLFDDILNISKVIKQSTK